MKRNQTEFNDMSFNLNHGIIAVNLLAVYHTVIKLPAYENPLSDDPTWHTLPFVCVVVKGSMKIAFDGRHKIIKENQVFFGKTGSDICVYDDGNNAEFYFFYFQIFNYALPYYESLNLPEDTDYTGFEVILNNLKMQTSLGIGFANSNFMHYLFGWLKNLHVSATANLPYSQMIYDMELYINQHIDERLLVSELAESCHLSEKHFRNLFAKIIGLPPKQYIENVKLEKVYHLITNTDLSIAQISDQMNFASPYHLTNAFKRVYGTAPSTCRKLFLAGKAYNDTPNEF